MEQELTILEKYKPKSLDDLKLPISVLTQINTIKDRRGYRLMLHGSAGLGKTTTALLLNKDTENQKFEVLYLSGSNEFNIHLMRDKVYPFVSSHSVLGKQKTIIIDEAENISDKIQDSFKIILDQAKKVNFIFITNEIQKMNPAVLSRCSNIEYVFNNNEFIEQQNNYISLIHNIITEEKLEFEPSGIKELYLKNFPDIRHSLVLIQQLKDSKLPITKETVRNTAEIGIQNIELYGLIENIKLDAQNFYTQVTTFKGKEIECFKSLGEPYFRYLNESGKFEQTLKSAVIIAKYSNMFHNSTSKFGTFFAMLVELRTIFR